MLVGVTQAVRRVKRSMSVWLCVCQRCPHQWTSFRAALPKTCPRCKARDWQRPAYYRHSKAKHK